MASFDWLTLRALAVELAEGLAGERVAAARADGDGLALAPDSGRLLLRLCYGPPARLRLSAGGELEAAREGPERYLQGAVLEGVTAAPTDRVLVLRLTRPDGEGAPTSGLLHLELAPPRFRAVLVGERHGCVLGCWAAAKDRRRFRPGEPFRQLPASGQRLDPLLSPAEALVATVAAVGPAPLEGVLARLVAGADRHIARRLCADVDVAADQAANQCNPDALTRLWERARQIYTEPTAGVWSWPTAAGRRVSVVAPSGSTPGLEGFDSVIAALCAPVEATPACSGTAASAGSGRGGVQRERLRHALRVLQRRERALAADLEEASSAVGGAAALEHRGGSLMAALGTVPPGPGRVEVPDVYDAAGKATVTVDLEPHLSSAEQAARLLKQARRFRRRLEQVPARLQQVREQLRRTRALLDALEGGGDGGHAVPEEEMERWQKGVDVRPPAARVEGNAAGRRGGALFDSEQVHPRRYRTSTGWSVWAGRNNRENDQLTHKVAAQNDIWFHAHGYAGSHVVLRREGRKDEPSARTLEEAAAVAAYWSKGRTARKVAVVYTLVKYVSHPRGGPPGLAVMKREKTLMVRPRLPDSDEATMQGECGG